MLATIKKIDQQALFCANRGAIKPFQLLTIDEFDGLLDLRCRENMDRCASNASALLRSIDVSIQTVPVPQSSLPKDLLDAFEKDVPLEVLRLLTGSTLMACGKGIFDHAQTIVDGLTPLFSKHVFVGMVRSIFDLATGRKDEALTALERLVEANPRDDTLLCMCALVKKQLGVSGWRSLAQCVVDRGEDADAVRVAEDLLAELAADADKKAVPSAKAALANMRFA